MVHKSEPPPPAEPRAAQKRRRAETREQILALAEQIVADQGAEALRLHDLASTLGYRTSALYRYFPSKDALILALLERAVDAIAQRVRDGLAEGDAIASRARRELSTGDRALIRIIAAARAYFDAADAQPAHTALVARMLADPKPIVSDAASAARAVPIAMATIAEVVAAFTVARTGAALARGNDAQRAALLWSSLQGLVTAKKMARFGVGGDFEALGSGLVRALLIGFGADVERVDEHVDRAFRRARTTGGER